MWPFLKLLLSDVEAELSGAFLPHFSLSWKFLALLHLERKKKEKTSEKGTRQIQEDFLGFIQGIFFVSISFILFT